VRITAQLIDALSGHHIWAERYDKDLKGIFAVQDEITKKIITSLQVELTEGEQARVYARGTENLAAYLKFLQGLWDSYQGSKEGNAKARRLAEEAIALDPNYAFAYRLLGLTHKMDVFLGTSKSPRKSMARAIEADKKAIALDESLAIAYAALGYDFIMLRQHDKAIALGEKALELEPNSAEVLHLHAAIITFAGRREEAIPLFREALRLNPKPPNVYYRHFGVALRDSGQYEEAIALQRKAIEQEHNDILAYILLASSASLAGREEEAQAAAKEILRINPKFSVSRYEKISPHKDRTVVKRFCDALRKAGLPDKPPLPLPDKPSIAVLPFTNMSEDPKQEYFADGMTEDLITDLSKISGLFIISRNSAFTYKGKTLKSQQISRELGVRYLLEGSVRRAGDRVRINAQLIDATTGGHLWAERYDGHLSDVFALQDEITQKIVAALAVKLTAGEQEQVARKETDNIAAYDACLKGWGHYLRHTPEDFAKALSYFEKAIELDPNYGRAYALIALIYARAPKLGKPWLDALYVFPLVADRRAKKYLEMAMRNPTSTAHRVASFINVHDRRYEAAIAEAERALSLDPNDSGSHENMAFVLIMAGRPKEAFDFAKKAIRLDPHNLANPLYYMGLAHFCLKEFEEAVNSLERALTYSPGHASYLVSLAAAYGYLDRKKEAQATVDRYLKALSFYPWWQEWRSPSGPSDLDVIMMFHYFYPPFKDPEMTDFLEDGLRKAGLRG
jgi:TolB-like protein/cytochrome c-type biogenesis protein CcmH/NrfG